jgi:hypothetical protein
MKSAIPALRLVYSSRLIVRITRCSDELDRARPRSQYENGVCMQQALEACF